MYIIEPTIKSKILSMAFRKRNFPLSNAHKMLPPTTRRLNYTLHEQTCTPYDCMYQNLQSVMTSVNLIQSNVSNIPNRIFFVALRN